jgi:hypothetical protein
MHRQQRHHSSETTSSRSGPGQCGAGKHGGHFPAHTCYRQSEQYTGGDSILHTGAGHAYAVTTSSAICACSCAPCLLLQCPVPVSCAGERACPDHHLLHVQVLATPEGTSKAALQPDPTPPMPGAGWKQSCNLKKPVLSLELRKRPPSPLAGTVATAAVDVPESSPTGVPPAAQQPSTGTASGSGPVTLPTATSAAAPHGRAQASAPPEARGDTVAFGSQMAVLHASTEQQFWECEAAVAGERGEPGRGDPQPEAARSSSHTTPPSRSLGWSLQATQVADTQLESIPSTLLESAAPQASPEASWQETQPPPAAQTQQEDAVPPARRTSAEQGGGGAAAEPAAPAAPAALAAPAARVASPEDTPQLQALACAAPVPSPTAPSDAGTVVPDSCGRFADSQTTQPVLVLGALAAGALDAGSTQEPPVTTPSLGAPGGGRDCAQQAGEPERMGTDAPRPPLATRADAHLHGGLPGATHACQHDSRPHSTAVAATHGAAEGDPAAGSAGDADASAGDADGAEREAAEGDAAEGQPADSAAAEGASADGGSADGGIAVGGSAPGSALSLEDSQAFMMTQPAEEVDLGVRLRQMHAAHACGCGACVTVGSTVREHAGGVCGRGCAGEAAANAGGAWWCSARWPQG